MSIENNKEIQKIGMRSFMYFLNENQKQWYLKGKVIQFIIENDTFIITSIRHPLIHKILRFLKID